MTESEVVCKPKQPGGMAVDVDLAQVDEEGVVANSKDEGGEGAALLHPTENRDEHVVMVV